MNRLYRQWQHLLQNVLKPLFLQSWKHWMHTQAVIGQGLVEYSLVLVLIAVVTIGILTQLGGRTSQIFSKVNCTLGGGAVASSSSNHPGNPQGGGGGIQNNTNTTTTGGC